MKKTNVQNSTWTDIDRYREMSELSQYGWWEYDISKRIFTLSEYIIKVLGLKSNTLHLADSLCVVDNRYVELFKEYINYMEQGIMDFCYHKIILKAPEGNVWVMTKRAQNIKNRSVDCIFGVLTVIAKENSRRKSIHMEGTDDLHRYQENLIKHMPIGYTRIKAIRNSQTGELNNYYIVEVNMHSSFLYNKHGEEIGKLGSEIHEPSVFKKNLEYLNEVLKNKKYIAQRVLTPSGIICRRIAYKSDEDEIVEFNVDLSETIDAIEAARRSNELFKNVFMNIPIGVSLYDTKGHITDMNKSFMDIYGISSPDDLEEYSFFDDANMTDTNRQNIESNGYTVFNMNYDFSKVDNYVTRRRDKANVNCKVVHLYSNQKDIGYLIISIEETDLLIAKNKVKEFENYFSLISDFAKIGYAKINLIGEENFGIRQWYKNFNEDENKSVKDIIGEFNTLYKNDKKKVLDFIKNVKQGKAEHLSRVVKVKGENGKQDDKWISIGILRSEYAPDKGVIEIIGVNYDITELKKTELELILARDKAEEMDRLKSAFLANMSHEIRTPLNAIVGFSDLLVKSNDQKERKLFFDILEKNNILLLKLINDILDLSKIEAGTMEFKYSDVDVNHLCNDIVMSMRLKVNGHVKIIFEPTEPDCHIITDATRLNQLISNLVNNSIKFTKEGHISITYTLERKNRIKFSVIDTGIGIDDTNRKHIFERFIKLNSFAPGTGLGLSICRSIVEQMGGKIGVDSEVGKGSRFWFVLPRQK